MVLEPACGGGYLPAMDAMIFSAGLGTRLAPLTDRVPKALVDLGGVTILEHVARRLVAAGADRLIINTHPHPGQIRDLVGSRAGFGADVVFSHEPDGPLDTAGGLRHARHLFRRDAPFFLHNCDVFSTIDLHALYQAHAGVVAGTLVTLAVLPPSAERFLIFDRRGLCGFAPRGGGEPVYARAPEGAEEKRDFSGIHVASPMLLDTLDDDAAPNIISHYLRLARSGTRIGKHDQSGAAWIDIGTHEKLSRARDLYRTLQRESAGRGSGGASRA